jgi:hypothetical protein
MARSTNKATSENVSKVQTWYVWVCPGEMYVDYTGSMLRERKGSSALSLHLGKCYEIGMEGGGGGKGKVIPVTGHGGP